MKNTRKIIISPSIWTQELATEHKLNQFLRHSLFTSRGRLSNFMRRSKFSYKRPTTTVQTMPKDGLDCKYCEKHIHVFISLRNIATMDKTPSWVDMKNETSFKR